MLTLPCTLVFESRAAFGASSSSGTFWLDGSRRFNDDDADAGTDVGVLFCVEGDALDAFDEVCAKARGDNANATTVTGKIIAARTFMIVFPETACGTCD